MASEDPCLVVPTAQANREFVAHKSQAPTVLSQMTLDYYNENSRGFWDGTKDHDVSQNYDALLSNIEAQPPFKILDLGCGPGRDLRYFSSLGHEAIGLDGAAEFVRMAKEMTGCEVWLQDFLELSLPETQFDGIFANASLFHVPREELPRVLGQLHDTLKPGGVLFSSNPRGNNEQGFTNGRFGSFHDYEAWTQYVQAAGFVEVTHYYRPPGQPRNMQPWLATVFRKPKPSQETGTT